ncbi:MAG: hypothetical protein RR561_02905 [Peptostreptococcus sp.]|uniref:hypothetical protein n=1 Tax=Peptostreptococcus sp. TaxID=1262 RepID=UPI002FC8525E
MKLLKITRYIIELIALLLFVLVNYFTNAKMGMMRHVMYKNIWFGEKVFTSSIINILALISVLLILANLFFIVKNKYSSLHDIFISVAILSLSIFFAKYFNVERIFTYYYMMISLSIIIFCELLKVLINIKYKNKSNIDKF